MRCKEFIAEVGAAPWTANSYARILGANERFSVMRLLFFLLLVCASATAQTPAPAARLIQVLIITGQDKHPWREASPYLKDLLQATGKFEVRTTEEFKGAGAETLRPYDVAVLVY